MDIKTMNLTLFENRFRQKTVEINFKSYTGILFIIYL